jgi:hypothetical protein
VSDARDFDAIELMRATFSPPSSDGSAARQPDAAGETTQFRGLSHRELLAIETMPTPQLIENMIERGTLGIAAGLPETFKSFYGLQVVIKISGAGPTVFDRKVLGHGPVGHWWQDDSRDNEVRRVQSYARAHDYTSDLPIRWHLNEGLTLPDGIPALRAEIEREGQVLVTLDSLYNFLPGFKLRDEDVAGVLRSLKDEVCDPTGCTILFIDHAPWPTEANSGQRRAYGSVFKTAAIRWGIYFEKAGDTIFIEAHGNNLAGISRTPAIWDAEALELRLVKPPSESDDLGDRIADFLRRNPGATTTVVKAGVEGDDNVITKRLNTDPRFNSVPPVIFGRRNTAKCWARAEDVPDLLREAQ